MKIIEFFTSEDPAHWLEEIRKCEWGAGQFLYSLLRDGKLKELVGQTALVPMLTDGDKLVSFCTLAPMDNIQPTELSPWIGFVYTFPEYRGHRYMGKLLHYAESIAAVMGREAVYISTGETGLYETYGYDFFEIQKDVEGNDSRVYRKLLLTDGQETETRKAQGRTEEPRGVPRGCRAAPPTDILR